VAISKQVPVPRPVQMLKIDEVIAGIESGAQGFSFIPINSKHVPLWHNFLLIVYENDPIDFVKCIACPRIFSSSGDNKIPQSKLFNINNIIVFPDVTSCNLHAKMKCAENFQNPEPDEKKSNTAQFAGISGISRLVNKTNMPNGLLSCVRMHWGGAVF
jgi:hypothetical protein